MTTRKTKASTGDEADDYGVGYGKPPKDTQFRPGQSGNAAGRRKGVRNLKTDVKRALATRVKVKRGSAARRQSAQETLLMLALEQALRGDARARDRLLDLASRFNNDTVEAGPEQPMSADDRAILAAYVAEHTSADMSPPTAEASSALTDPPDELAAPPRDDKKARK